MKLNKLQAVLLRLYPKHLIPSRMDERLELLSHNIDAPIFMKGKTLLMLATVSVDFEAILDLLDAGANPFLASSDSLGSTAYDLAVLAELYEIAALMYGISSYTEKHQVQLSPNINLLISQSLLSHLFFSFYNLKRKALCHRIIQSLNELNSAEFSVISQALTEILALVLYLGFEEFSEAILSLSHFQSQADSLRAECKERHKDRRAISMRDQIRDKLGLGGSYALLHEHYPPLAPTLGGMVEQLNEAFSASDFFRVWQLLPALMRLPHDRVGSYLVRQEQSSMLFYYIVSTQFSSERYFHWMQKANFEQYNLLVGAQAYVARQLTDFNVPLRRWCLAQEVQGSSSSAVLHYVDFFVYSDLLASIDLPDPFGEEVLLSTLEQLFVSRFRQFVNEGITTISRYHPLVDGEPLSDNHARYQVLAKAYDVLKTDAGQFYFNFPQWQCAVRSINIGSLLLVLLFLGSAFCSGFGIAYLLKPSINRKFTLGLSASLFCGLSIAVCAITASLLYYFDCWRDSHPEYQRAADARNNINPFRYHFSTGVATEHSAVLSQFGNGPNFFAELRYERDRLRRECEMHVGDIEESRLRPGELNP